jgi:hypothetical protein
VSAATEKADEKAKEAEEATAKEAAKGTDATTPPKPKKAAIEGC